MAKRGRRSIAELTLIGPGGIEQIRRPAPPATLTEEAAVEWRAIVDRMPPDWFPRETHAMLVQLCRAIVRSHQIDTWLSNRSNLSVEEFQSLLRSEQSVSDLIGRLSTKMRLSQSSKYDDGRKRRDYSPKKMPWDDDTTGNAS